MKLNKLFVLPLLTILTSCNVYRGATVELNYVENGALTAIDGYTLYESAITNTENIAFLLASSECSHCASVKTKFSSYCEENHCNIYYADIDKVTSDEEYSTFGLAIDNGTGYTLPESRSYFAPQFFIFSYGIVAVAVSGKSDCIDALKYLSVSTDGNSSANPA